MSSAYHYEPLLCPRCHKPLEHINEVHKNKNYNVCTSRKKSRGAFVYLFHDEHQNLLKIGFTENPQRRFKEIKNANTNKITFIGYFEGSRTNESILHNIWKKYRKRLEWFYYADEIVDYFRNHPKFNEWKQ
jgi:hypothetical protein